MERDGRVREAHIGEIGGGLRRGAGKGGGGGENRRHLAVVKEKWRAESTEKWGQKWRHSSGRNLELEGEMGSEMRT